MDKGRKFLPVIIFLFFWGFSFSLAAEESADDFPAWLKRIEFSAQYETDQKPMVYFQMVQPLYQSLDKQLYFTSRVSL